VRRADRLFRIVQRLRRRGVTTARYVDKGGAGSARTIWPLGLFFWGKG